MAVDWSTLPQDILALVAMKLETIEDFIYFSAVSREWNCVSSLIKSKWRVPQIPWLLLAENTQENPDCFRKVFNLRNNKCYKLNLPNTFGTKCWGCAYGWVVLVHPNLSIELFNPITKSQICFPSLESLPHLILYDEELEPLEEEYITWLLSCFLIRFMVIKVSEGDHDEFVIVLLYDNYEHLAFGRHDSQLWTSVCTNGRVVDVVGINDNVLALYEDGAIEFWNVKEFQNLKILKPVVYSPPAGPRMFMGFTGLRHIIYLVQSGTHLFMVLRSKVEVLNSDADFDSNIGYKTRYFHVYKLDPKDKSWARIHDLGDVALFVGNNFSISVAGAITKILQPSCIYFTDDEYQYWDTGKFGGHDMEVYNNISGDIWRYYEDDDTRSKMCPPTLFIPVF